MFCRWEKSFKTQTFITINGEICPLPITMVAPQIGKMGLQMGSLNGNPLASNLLNPAGEHEDDNDGDSDGHDDGGGDDDDNGGGDDDGGGGGGDGDDHGGDHDHDDGEETCFPICSLLVQCLFPLPSCAFNV